MDHADNVDHDRGDDLDGQEAAHRFAFTGGTPAPATSGIQCPRCHRHHSEQRHLGRRVGGAIGTVAGAIGGACSALGGLEIGMAVGAAAFGPPGALLGAISGAVISALLGGSTGWTIGSKLGSAIDATVLDDYRCMSCQHTFSLPVGSPS